MRKLHLAGLVAVVATVGALALGPATAGAAPKPRATASPDPVPVAGTVGGDAFAGNFDVERFATQNGGLVAVGDLTGTRTPIGGPASQVAFPNLAIPISDIQAPSTCDILTLVLGPLHLDLLGLVVDLNQVVLTITGERGPGNLLGNLLCGLAGLLDPADQARALNRALGLP